MGQSEVPAVAQVGFRTDAVTTEDDLVDATGRKARGHGEPVLAQLLGFQKFNAQEGSWVKGSNCFAGGGAHGGVNSE